MPRSQPHPLVLRVQGAVCQVERVRADLQRALLRRAQLDIDASDGALDQMVGRQLATDRIVVRTVEQGARTGLHPQRPIGAAGFLSTR